MFFKKKGWINVTLEKYLSSSQNSNFDKTLVFLISFMRKKVSACVIQHLLFYMICKVKETIVYGQMF